MKTFSWLVTALNPLQYWNHFLFKGLCIYPICTSVQIDASDFIFDGRYFHIVRLQDLRLWVPNLLVLIRLTMMSLCLTFRFPFDGNIFFAWRGLISFMFLSIFTANVLDLLISMVFLFLLVSKQASKQASKHISMK